MENLFKILSILTMLPNIIASIEQIKGGTTGPEKLSLVEEQVMLALQASEIVAGREIVNEKQFRKEMKKAVSGIVGMLNNSAWAKK